MTLNELNTKPLASIIAEMDMVSFKVHTNDQGIVIAVETKYAPRGNRPETQPEKKGWSI